jgi:hypothetical protein
MVISLSPFLTVMPIISFLFVFILIYALLQKTKLLGDNNLVSLFLSFIIATFFIVNVRLVDFVRINVSWFAVFFICLFLIMTVLAFTGKDAIKIVSENKAVAWIILAILVIVFIFSSSYVFNWALSWDVVQSWFDQSWFGMVALIVVAAIVSVVLTKGGVVPGE